MACGGPIARRLYPTMPCCRPAPSCSRRPERGVWAGLWSLPEFDSVDALREHIADWPGRTEVLPTISHVLTHFDWALSPVRHVLPSRSTRLAERLAQTWPDGRWVDAADLARYGLPAPVAKLLAG